MPVHNGSKRYTVDAVLADGFAQPCELIRGRIEPDQADTTYAYQNALIALGSLIVGFVRANTGAPDEKASCGVFVERVDVVLSGDTLVRPDIVVVTDFSQLANDRYVQGAPAIAIHVNTQPPEAADGKWQERCALYDEAGVGEVVAVWPEHQRVEIYRRKPGAGNYGAPEVLGPPDVLSFDTLPGLKAPVGDVFGWPA